MSPAVAMAPNLATLFARLAVRGEDPLLWSSAGPTTATAVLDRADQLFTCLHDAGVGPGTMCAFSGDYDRDTVALFLALAALGAVAVPFSTGTAAERDALAAEIGVAWWIDPATGTLTPTVAAVHGAAPAPLVADLVAVGHPGLVVFTSGSTGKPKAILHDIERVAGKFVTPRPARRMVLFLLMDHFGGFNTLMSVFAHGSLGVCAHDRTPRSICAAIAEARAELLPATPTFFGMLIASGLWREYDLSSIRLVTYGAEPMPPTTLARLRDILPHAEFKQTYGLSELGVLRSESPDPGSLWVRIGGDGFETRIVDGVLHIRSASSMLGYLNAPNPIDADGWMNTGDIVEEKDGLVRFLGRRTEVINVGGQKVLPTEIEDVLLSADGVVDAVAAATPHPLLGQAVVARVALATGEDARAVTDRLRAHCRARLQKYKVPMRFEIVESTAIASPRAKKQRR
jgi:acyl-CoA synthetase (AMP-forming)/AMP-acid ligase II